MAVALTGPLGLLTRADIPLPAVIATYGGDTLYATLIFFLAALLWPSWTSWRLALIALSFCYAIELSQLYKTPWLDALRGTLPGRLVLGAGFRWDDMLCYPVGVLLATAVDWLWLRARVDCRSNGRCGDGTIMHRSGRHHDGNG